MRITKSRLKQLIKEEIKNILYEWPDIEGEDPLELEEDIEEIELEEQTPAQE